MKAEQSERRYTIRTYAGPPLPCAECGRDIKAITHFNFGLSSEAWPDRYFCDALCFGWWAERQALESQSGDSR